MEKALGVLNELVRRGIIGRYAIGGAMGALFYTEPFSTFDLDIFVFIRPGDAGLISLSPLYSALSDMGYEPEGECVDIEGIPVQFLVAYNDLAVEALDESVAIKYGDTDTYVLKAEYLVAIALQTGRPKDRERVRLLRDEAPLDQQRLSTILDRFGLRKRWMEWMI